VGENRRLDDDFHPHSSQSWASPSPQPPAADLGYRRAMSSFPPGWATDLAILELSGSTIEQHADHLVVRSPHNPGFHWGNCVFVTDPDAVDDADRWVAVFTSAFPEAGWVAIGLTRMPDAVEAWTSHGLALELDDVLTTTTLPRQTPCPEGYSVRPLAEPDWQASLARAVAENTRTREHDADGFAQFAQRRTQSRRNLVEQGHAQCAAARDGTQWVIVTEETNAAGRVYRGVGFAPDSGSISAYRHPTH